MIYPSNYSSLTLEYRFKLLDSIILDLANYSDSLEFQLELENIKEELSVTGYETILKVGNEL